MLNVLCIVQFCTFIHYSTCKHKNIQYGNKRILEVTLNDMLNLLNCSFGTRWHQRVFNCIAPFLSQQNLSKIVSEYDQEIQQSQTADNPVAPRARAAQPLRDTRKTN